MITANIGSIKIFQTPEGIRVEDGTAFIQSNSFTGTATYTRTKTGGVLFINGIEAGRHTKPQSGQSNSGCVSGHGLVCDIKSWSRPLTEAQAKVIR